MKTDTPPNGYFSNLLLPGTILLANVDVTGLVAYGLKAALGGGIWLLFKIIADRFEQKKPGVPKKKTPVRSSDKKNNAV